MSSRCLWPCHKIAYERHLRVAYGNYFINFHTHKKPLKCRIVRVSSVWPAFMSNVCLACTPYVGVRTIILICLKNIVYLSVCQRMPACFNRIQPMPNVALTYVSVYQRISDVLYTLTHASTIPYSVIGP